MTSLKPVIVRWLDAEHPSDGIWTTKTDLDKKPDLNVFTCGYLVHKDENSVQVAVSVTSYGKDDEQYSGIMTIPTVCVNSIYEMVETKKKVK